MESLKFRQQIDPNSGSSVEFEFSKDSGAMQNAKKCYILAGPNGAGKTSFANQYLPIEGECLNFMNADLIALGLSPFNPEKMRIEAGRLMIKNMNECARKGESFAFETTLSGKTYIGKISDWKRKGYCIIIYFFKLTSVELAIERVKHRVSLGGHGVSEKDIRRRFSRSWGNFNMFYKPLADSWTVFDSSSKEMKILDELEKAG